MEAFGIMYMNGNMIIFPQKDIYVKDLKSIASENLLYKIVDCTIGNNVYLLYSYKPKKYAELFVHHK